MNGKQTMNLTRIKICNKIKILICDLELKYKISENRI